MFLNLNCLTEFNFDMYDSYEIFVLIVNVKTISITFLRGVYSTLVRIFALKYIL